MNFIWDENKNAKNKKQHGISFETAAHAFADQMRRRPVASHWFCN
jgi:uncharacterized DUF497 family protein